MSQVITNAFEQYWQSSLAAEQPVVLDEFILADIPNLDITAPIDPDTVLPPESQIVHRQNVDQRGRVNNNAVAYTIVMDTTIGDFSFNAMYLRNKQNGVIGMIVYKGRETKLKTDQTTGQTGNSLVKSMLMGYDQAAEATLTHVDAGTWQIDYAARLRGMDEDIRQLQADLYGHHTFVGDGFKVVEKDGAYQVSQGVAIIGGLRVELKAPEVIHPGSKPIGVWVDVHRAGSLLSEHQNLFTIITSVADLADHVDSNGYQHYVAKLATVQSDSTVVDGRGNTGSGSTGFIPDTYALWKRSLAEAGFTLRPKTESFRSGGVITSATDVLLDDARGKAFSHAGPYPRHVDAGTDPTASGSGFIDRSYIGEAGIYGTISDINAGKFPIGKYVTVTDRNRAIFKIEAGGEPNGQDIVSAGSGNTARLSDAPSIKALGGKVDGGRDDFAQLQSLCNYQSSAQIDDGVILIGSQLVISKARKYRGGGPLTVIKAKPGVTGSLIRISPTVGIDPKGLSISDLTIEADADNTNVFSLDLSIAGAYLSKFTLANVISKNPTSAYFAELVNGINNSDGLFTSVFKDNWSDGGYYMSNIGDSIYFIRNTVTGEGYGYYINQLGTAANVTIRDGNVTVSSNALYCVKGSNITFDNNQVECAAPFVGQLDACVAFDHSGGNLVFNNKITNNSINTKGATLYCIYLQETDNTIIDGNNLYCDPSTGAHIYIDAMARNTIIGNNKYFSAVTGAEIDPIIVDLGVGTSGVWKDATISLSGWTSQGTGSEHALGSFKNRDGEVQLRGRVGGPASVAGTTIFTLPVGCRPKTKAYIVGVRGTVAGSPAFVDIQITPTGAVQFVTANATSAYLTGVRFSAI